VGQIAAVLGNKAELDDAEHELLAGLTARVATAVADPATCLAAMALTLLEVP
jgi:hypothetical protein